MGCPMSNHRSQKYMSNKEKKHVPIKKRSEVGCCRVVGYGAQDCIIKRCIDTTA